MLRNATRSRSKRRAAASMQRRKESLLHASEMLDHTANVDLLSRFDSLVEQLHHSLQAVHARIRPHASFTHASLGTELKNYGRECDHEKRTSNPRTTTIQRDAYVQLQQAADTCDRIQQEVARVGARLRITLELAPRFDIAEVLSC